MIDRAMSMILWAGLAVVAVLGVGIACFVGQCYREFWESMP